MPLPLKTISDVKNPVGKNTSNREMVQCSLIQLDHPINIHSLWISARQGVLLMILQRYWPEEVSLAVTIPAGEMTEATHVLHHMMKDVRELVDGKYVLRVEGYWFSGES